MKRLQMPPFLLHFFLLSLLPSKATTSSPGTQAEALITWKNSFNSYYPPSSLDSWSLSNLNNLCNWTAIVCDLNTKTVSKIDLSNLQITATLTHFNFTPFLNITQFYLHQNSFGGPIPSAIGNLSRLTILDLGNNFFEQEIPAEIGLLTELKYLSFYNNTLDGTIPYQLSNLRKVQFLLLGENHLKTSNWSKFSGMHSLTHLDLNQNFIHSEFPEFIFECQNLTFLDLSHNQLTGQITEPVFTKLGKLEYLSLTHNLFQGPLPSNFPKLQHLYLAGNNFSGQIPTTIGQLRELQSLDLGMNSLNSSIPSELGHCTDLTHLSLASNFLSGELPHSLSNLNSILHLNFSDNVFTGPISPYVISNWSLVFNLNLRGNRFSGNIPPELGQLTNLHYLSLDSNDFGGELPSQIGNLNLLYTLNVSRNHLTGVIPQSIGNLTQIESLDLSNNNLTGVIPPGPHMFDNLQYCYLLDFSSNLLSGAIPSNLGNLTGLEIFNVSHNHLSGEFPSYFSNMDVLTIYDFSYNNLTGPIPTCGIFREAPGDAFIGNYGMWRDAKGTAACNSSGDKSKTKNDINSAVVVIISFLGFYVVETIIGFFIFLVLRKRSKLRPQEIKTSQNFENFESMIMQEEVKFTFGEVVKAVDDFHEKYCIGIGGFGRVYKAELESGQVVAVKRLNTEDSNDIPAINLRSFDNEIRTLINIRHRNIIRLYGFCSRRGCIFLLYEYFERGSLGKSLCGVEGITELGWATRVKILKRLAHALSYLHNDCSPPIVHRDVTVNNVLLDQNFEPRLSDFGTARLLSTNSSNWTHIVGSFGYMAPGHG